MEHVKESPHRNNDSSKNSLTSFLLFLFFRKIYYRSQRTACMKVYEYIRDIKKINFNDKSERKT